MNNINRINKLTTEEQEQLNYSLSNLNGKPLCVVFNNLLMNLEVITVATSIKELIIDTILWESEDINVNFNKQGMDIVKIKNNTLKDIYTKIICNYFAFQDGRKYLNDIRTNLRKLDIYDISPKLKLEQLINVINII